MDQIICPVDFSPASMPAVEWALRLAKKKNACLNFIHAWHFSPPDVVSGESGPDPEKETSLKFNDLLNRIRQQTPPDLPEIKTHSVRDFAENAIRELADRLGSQLIVMGTHGNTSMENILLGSVATDVMASSKVPVMLVPSGAGLEDPAEFVFATDLREYDLDSLNQFCALSTLYKAPVEVVHIHLHSEKFIQEDFDKYENELRSKLNFPKTRFHIFKSTKIEEGLNEFVKNKSSAVIGMVKRRRNFLQSLFEHSHTRRMATHSQIPLIVYPQPK